VLSLLTVSLFKRRGRNRFQVPSEVNIRISRVGRDTLATDVTEKPAALVSFLNNQSAGLAEMSVFMFTKLHGVISQNIVMLISLILFSILRQAHSLFTSQFSTVLVIPHSISLILFSILRQAHSLFTSQFSTVLVIPHSISSTLYFP